MEGASAGKSDLQTLTDTRAGGDRASEREARVEMSTRGRTTRCHDAMALLLLLLCITNLLADERHCGGDAHALQGRVAPADETDRLGLLLLL